MNSLVAIDVARRDLRGSLKSFVVLYACLALGVAAICAVGLLNNSVTVALERDARILLGGDIAIDVASQPLDAAELDGLLPEGAPYSKTVDTNSIAVAGNGRSVPVSIKAVDQAYPLLGEVLTGTGQFSATSLAADEVLVDPTLLPRLGVEQNDLVRIGQAQFKVRDTVLSEPDRIGGVIGVGPRAMLSVEGLERAGIVLPGSLVRYYYRVILPEGVSSAAYEDRMELLNPERRWRIRDAEGLQPQIARLTNRLSSYLTLAGLASLLIGGCGVAIASQHYFRRKQNSIATLKCLGAQGADIAAIYVAQILIVSLLGVVAGLALGTLLPLAIYLLPVGLLPVRVEFSFSVTPVIVAALFGLGTALLFTILPLARARRVSPAQIFRTVHETSSPTPRRPELLVIAGFMLLLMLLVFLTIDQLKLAIIALGGAAALVIVLTVMARLAVRGAQWIAARTQGPIRMAFHGLARPGAPTSSVIVALGCGLGVLATVTLLQHNLMAELQRGVPDRAPAVVLLDIQPDQQRAVRELLAQTEGVEVLQALPMLRARVTRIGGETIDPETLGDGVRWTTRRDRGLTYLAEKPEHTELLAGEWWPQDYDGPPLVSIEDELAEGFGVGIGDTLTFNVLGRPLTAEIASLRREIDYTSGRLDFIFILNPTALESAPHTIITSLDVASDVEAELLNRLAQDFPNVTPISVGQVIDRATSILQRIGFAVQAVAIVTIVSGILVLIGAVNSARSTQLYEASIFKVLGARRRDLLSIFLGEYACLGLISGFIGVIIGTVAAWAVVRFVFQFVWSFSLLATLQVILAAVVLALLIGALGLWRDLAQPAWRLLRAE